MNESVDLWTLGTVVVLIFLLLGTGVALILVANERRDVRIGDLGAAIILTGIGLMLLMVVTLLWEINWLELLRQLDRRST